MTNFSIKTEVFEGPLELLIELVEKRKLLINDISLASVTDEYMSEVAKMQQMSLPGTANFIALASTLLLIKSKSLLPVLTLTEEEESSIEELEERLRLYQIYKSAGLIISNSFGRKIMYSKGYTVNNKPIFHPDTFCNLNSIKEAISRVIKELPIQITPPKVQVKKIVSLEEMIERLNKRINTELKLRFSDLVADTREPHTLIVGFLAVLESVKQGSILVAQLNKFEEIEIEHAGVSIPSYK